MKMIKRLRAKFVIVSMVVLTVVMGFLLVFLNAGLIRLGNSHTRTILNEMLENDGFRTKTFMLESYSHTSEENENNQKQQWFFSRFVPFDIGSLRNTFAVRFYTANSSIEILSPYPLHYTNQELTDLIESVIARSDTWGNVNGIRYGVAKKNYGVLAVFADRRMEDNVQYRVIEISLLVFLSSLAVAFLVALLLSRWAVKPVKTAFLKQKQFVADASHELKTPLAVIDTNLAVLKDDVGDNKWFSYIHSEVTRMSFLVKDLLFLAKYDDNERLYEFKEFNISRAIMSSILPFESLAFEKGRGFNYQVEENLMYIGDEKRIKQLVVILLDNAVKHSDVSFVSKKPTIELSVKRNGFKIELNVFNTGKGLSEKECKKIFERFYRSDSSRNRNTGGSGLGLSIATAIVKAHKAKIEATSVIDESITFSVIL